MLHTVCQAWHSAENTHIFSTHYRTEHLAGMAFKSLIC
jgi:hypothetical protein